LKNWKNGFDSRPSNEAADENPHTMTVAGEGRAPEPSHLSRLAALAGISSRDAAAIIDEVGTAVARWPEWAELAGVSKKSRDTIKAMIQAG